ncbi:transcriptional regulator FilR1 domain-containing protein [Halopiger goleimassiliensis]|uniref:transcriptional regulator FilR1 domain-containing protein n=1 Tax=Halopiger goleimassiliensis TaxID=1293048 RepID=UPI00067821B9|nr:transcriptional regulator [Halopiger goleimassiliensis]
MAEGTFEEEILLTAVERRDALALLADGPYHRREIQAELELSKTTCHRIVRTFDDYGLLERTDDGYKLTATGELLASAVDDYVRDVRTTFECGPFVAAFAETDVTFDVDAFRDARITRPEPNDPTLPLDREFDVFREADHFTLVDGNQHVPELYLEQVIEIGLEHGKEAEHIAPLPIVEKRLTQFPEVHKRHSEVDATLQYRICPDVPFGLVLYEDEHVVVRTYDEVTGSIELMADTDADDAVAWARDVIQHYREKADPPSAYDDLPDWTPDERVSFLDEG